jgi:phage terminase large subunit GpA-like protein
MGVDVAHNRITLTIWAYGRDDESWLVYFGEEYGITANPADPVWAALDNIVDREYPHASGAQMRIEAVSIDSSDGQTSDAVYSWVRRRDRGGVRVMAVKGRSGGDKEIYTIPPARSIDPSSRPSKAARHGVKVYLVGTERAKDLLLGFTAEGGRIKRCDRSPDGSLKTGRGPGRIHWYRGVRDDFHEQLADSEVKIPSARNGGKLAWTLKTGRENHGLDTTVYALHAQHALRLHLNDNAQWSARERTLRIDPADKAKPNATPTPPARLGFASTSPAVDLP